MAAHCGHVVGAPTPQVGEVVNAGTNALLVVIQV